MKDNDFLNSYKKNLESENDMFLEQPTVIEKSEKPVVETNRRATSPKGKATRANPVRHVQAPDDSMTYEEKNAFYAPRYTQYGNAPGNSGGGGSFTKRLILVAVMAIILFACIFMLVSLTNNIKVIDFTGWQKADFMLWASENKINAQTEEQFSDEVAEGYIISQLIPPGEKIKKNQFLKVFISKGPDMSVEYYLPDFMNMSKDEIEAWAADNLMSKVRISVENSDTIPKGQVITFQVNDDTVIDKVKRDTPIYIIISRGSEDEYAPLAEIKIPNFKTMGLSASMLFAQENGLNVIVVNQYDEYVPPNTIISQSLSVDSIAHPGDTVTLVVSQGQKILMPSFKQLEKGDAMSLAAQLGVPLKIKERYSSSDEGRMIYQSVEVGTEITKDTTLELTYSMGPVIAVRSYIGMQKFNIEEWINGENEYGARLVLDITYTQNSAAAGTILQQNIKDEYVYRDTVIQIVVSTGNVCFVPDFVAVNGAGYDLAITREEAESMAEQKGLILLFIKATDATRLPGEVWWQSVPAGTEVDVGTIITLKYNPVDVTLDVPNYVGMTVAAVMASPEYQNLDVIFQPDVTNAATDIVTDQSITAFSTVAYGTELILNIN